jgi:hypothetical protein
MPRKVRIGLIRLPRATASFRRKQIRNRNGMSVPCITAMRRIGGFRGAQLHGIDQVDKLAPGNSPQSILITQLIGRIWRDVNSFLLTTELYNIIRINDI